MKRLPPGVRVLDRLMKARPETSIARMDAEALRRAQTTVIPDGGPAALMLGRARRGVTITTDAVTSAQGHRLPLRIYTPSRPGGPRPVVVNYHGGGFVLGSARQSDWLCSAIADDVDAVVVSVDYRLAPTHRFPAAVDDCYEALTWTAEHAAGLGGDPARLGVMGDSAGGNLATVTAITARDRGGPAIAHQALIYPVTDRTEQAGKYESYRNHPGLVLTDEDMAAFGRHYAEEGTDLADWRISPVQADLAGLPPAIVVVAGLDPLHDSGVVYAEALRAAGVPAELSDYPDMPHGFLSFPYLCRSSRPAVRAVVGSQRAALRPDSP